MNIRRASSAEGSLERIHTFNLKLLQLQNKGSDVEKKQQLVTLTNMNQKTSRNKDDLRRGTDSVTSIASDKAFYVEEKTKVLENVIVKVQPIIAEF